MNSKDIVRLLSEHSRSRLFPSYGHARGASASRRSSSQQERSQRRSVKQFESRSRLPAEGLPLCGRTPSDYASRVTGFRRNPSSRRIALMGYRSLRECVRDLERTGQLVVIDQEIDPHLEAAAIQRRVYQAGGPALYFSRVKGTSFPAGVQPVRDARPGPVPVSRHARGRPPAGGAEGRPGRRGAEALALSGRAADALAPPAQDRASRGDPRAPDDDRPPAGNPVVADGRRAVHHPAPGLHRGPRPARPGSVEPGDVPRSALGQCSTC